MDKIILKKGTTVRLYGTGSFIVAVVRCERDIEFDKDSVSLFSYLPIINKLLYTYTFEKCVLYRDKEIHYYTWIE